MCSNARAETATVERFCADISILAHDLRKAAFDCGQSSCEIDLKETGPLSLEGALGLSDEIDAMIARGCPVRRPARRTTPSLERLRASVGLVAVSYPMASWTPSLTPSLIAPPPPPRVLDSAPVSGAVPTLPPPVAGGRSPGTAEESGDGGLTPCQDLKNKAQRLREAAAQCDRDVSNGARSCQVKVTFTSPRIPDWLAPRNAEYYAGRFERVAAGGSEQACAEHGGEGSIPSARQRGAASLREADRYYSGLCSAGDDYACDAGQIAQLCFNTSSTNNCVRDCLVDNDARCAAMSGDDERLDCRKRNHWLCYESVCPKYLPNPVEVMCFSRFPHWKQFLCPPGINWEALCH